ncbi:MAG: hypothetical protein M3347_08480 [Armatimonadota bacterium]|nr:hypothetical protein [Armatimonadota bacterium]
MAISDDRLRVSLRRTEQRWEEARKRRARQVRNLRIAGIVLLLIILAGLLSRWTAPPAPLFVVRWPHPKLHQNQIMSDGSVVLLRRGKALIVSVTDPERWKLRWMSEDIRQEGGQCQWSPLSDTAMLTVRCRARASGFGHLVAWLWPSRELRLHGKAATLTPTGRQQVVPPAGQAIWLFPMIVAASPVAWDDRTLGLLVQAGTSLPATTALGAPPRLWTLVPSFNDEIDPRDTGTYAQLATAPVEKNMFAIARRIAKAKPTASLKFVVRLDKNPPLAILRIALDGKGKRSAWIKRPGDAAGQTVPWRENES